MPPNNQKFTNMTSEQRNNVPLLSMFQCRLCKKNKPPQAYSNKELNNYKFRVANGGKFNSTNADVTCRGCRGEQVHELQCKGPCTMVKVLDDFSKNQRQGRDAGHWCKQCIGWKEAAEPDVTTLAAPNTQVAPDEDPSWGDGWGDDPEGECDSDYGDMDFGPYKSMASLSVQERPVTIPTDQTANADRPATITAQVASSRPAVGAHVAPVAGPSNTFTAAAPRIAQATSIGLRPPHLPKENMSTAGESSTSNPYAARAEANTASVASWSVVAAKRRGPSASAGLPFNAYDPSGQLHQRHRTPSTADQTPSQYRNGSGPGSVSVSVSVSGVSQSTPSVGYRAPIAAGRTAAIGATAIPRDAGPVPTSASGSVSGSGPASVLPRTPAEPIRDGRRNWAKPIGRRVAPPTFPVNTGRQIRQPQRNRGYDSDDQDDL